jgi:hypothetical protein
MNNKRYFDTEKMELLASLQKSTSGTAVGQPEVAISGRGSGVKMLHGHHSRPSKRGRSHKAIKRSRIRSRLQKKSRSINRK